MGVEEDFERDIKAMLSSGKSLFEWEYDRDPNQVCPLSGGEHPEEPHIHSSAVCGNGFTGGYDKQQVVNTILQAPEGWEAIEVEATPVPPRPEMSEQDWEES